jgi:hypothetical protein
MTLPTGNTFVGVDVSQVIDHGDGIHRADLGAFGASDTGHRAMFFGCGAFFLTPTIDPDSLIAPAFGAHFEDNPGAGFNAFAAASAFFLIYHW